MRVFSQETNELGEAPLWHPERYSVFWLDILNRQLFEKRFDSQKQEADSVWPLPEFASAMARDKHDKNLLWMVTDKSFGKYDLLTHRYHSVLKLGLENAYRANDGGVAPDGSFWFGTMEWSPSGVHGGIYSISPSAVLRKQPVKIGIPNTFCWNPAGDLIYISDSFQQKIFIFEVENQYLNEKTSRVFADLRNGHSTPDGGAFDSHGCLWNAHWDGHKVVKYDASATIHKEISMPVPKPTSCCFGGPENRYLFVTSAWTTMNRKEIKKYPMSGKIFVGEQAVAGAAPLPFSLET